MELSYADNTLRDVFTAFDYIIAIFIFQMGLLFLNQWIKEKKKQLKNIIVLGFGFYFIFFSVSLFIIFSIMNNPIQVQNYDFYFVLSIYLRGIAGIFLILVLEHTVQSSLKMGYWILLILIGLLVAIPVFLGTSLFYPILNLLNLLLVIFPIILTLIFIAKTVGGVRLKLLIGILGFFLLGGGLSVSTPRILNFIEATFSNPSILIFISKFLAISGISLIFFGFNGYSFFLKSQWRDNIISLFIIDKKRLKILYTKNFFQNNIANEEIFAGGITGIEGILKELTSTKEGIDVIKLGNRIILLSHGEEIITALIVKKNIQNLDYILREITKNFEFFFWDYLKYYESYNSILSPSQIFRPMEILISKLFKI